VVNKRRKLSKLSASPFRLSLLVAAAVAADAMALVSMVLVL
jgi:hypothetical protein